jgi:hypothetical protein
MATCTTSQNTRRRWSKSRRNANGFKRRGTKPIDGSGLGIGISSRYSSRCGCGFVVTGGGEIWCTGTSKEKNWLIWRKDQPADFVLRLEFRWDKGNSGVQVRSDDLGKWMVHGYQVEVAQQNVMGLWHHSLLATDHPKKQARHLMVTAGQMAVLAEDGSKTVEQNQDAESVKAHFKEHAWNTMEIVASGDRLVQKINGLVFSTVVDRDKEMSRTSGFIALQDHGKGCKVAFRKIRIRLLLTNFKKVRGELVTSEPP